MALNVDIKSIQSFQQPSFFRLFIQRPSSYSNNWYTFAVVFHNDYWILLAGVTLTFSLGVTLFKSLLMISTEPLIGTLLEATGNTFCAYGTLAANFKAGENAATSYRSYILTIMGTFHLA